MTLLVRSFTVETDGRTLVGSALRWDTPYRVTDDVSLPPPLRRFYDEGWRRGAFGRSIRQRRNVFELRADHQDFRLGLAHFHESETTLDFEAPLDNVPEADAVLEVANAGDLGVSIGFRSIRHDTNGAVVWRTEANLRELSVSDARDAQYGTDARVLAVRAASSVYDPRIAAKAAAILAWSAPEL